LGGGTTAIACKNTKRNFKGTELNKEYYDKVIKILNPELSLSDLSLE
jgi:DNA modification methylase